MQVNPGGDKSKDYDLDNIAKIYHKQIDSMYPFIFHKLIKHLRFKNIETNDFYSKYIDP